jgi:cell division septation protein DedD
VGPLSAALFGLACVTVLVLTFVLGMLVGRQWARRAAPSALGVAASADTVPRGSLARGREGTAGEPDRGGGAELEETRPRTARKLSERERDDATPQIREKLTFYQTLTAPLTAGPRPPKRPATLAVPGEAPRESGRESGPALAGAGPTTGAYTIQIGAFRTRAQADKVRDTLGAAAYVLEAVGTAEARFRVRVGAFGDRAEAETAAARLRTEHGLVGFVTTR